MINSEPVDEFSTFLDKIEAVHQQLRMIWPEGRNPCVSNDGQHWRLPSFERPVSVGRVEAFFLYNLASISVPKVILEIGTGFGYSSLWLAAGANAAGLNSELFTIDDQSEGGIGEEGLRFARWAATETGLSNNIHFVHGKSPDILPNLFKETRVNLSFIDGNHHGDQPYLDFKGASAVMDPGGIIIWHDVDKRYSVPLAFQKAIEEGWRGKVFYTSCRIGVSYRYLENELIVNAAYEAARNLQPLKTQK